MSYQSELSKLGIDTKGQFSGLIKTKCPKCSSTRKKQNDPCLSVNIDTGLYKCHNCQWSGSASARQYNVPEPRKEGPDGRIQAYFSGRGILPLTVESFRITMAVETMPQDGKKHLTVCFNYYDDMSLVNIKFKTSTKLFKMVTGAKKIAYNLNSIKESDYVIICEGEEETMVWHQSGYPHVVSCPGGANVNTNNLEWLDNSYQYFENKKIILATDSDAPGRKLRDDLARRFEHSDVYVVSFPDDCKDANDVLKLYGSEYLGNLFKEAKLLPIKELSEALDYRDLIFTYRSDGYPKGATVAMNDTDKLLSWNRGELVVCSGVPGCFDKEQLIHTRRGVVPISEITTKDYVLSYNQDKDINEWRRVLATPIHKTTPDKMYKITMKDGTIIKVTENHEFFTGVSYLQIKDLLLSLKNDKNMEENTSI